MTTDVIIKYLESLFGTNKIYMSNFRGWDFEMIMKFGEFHKDFIVLDTGALHSYFSVYLAQFVRQIVTTDDMSWAERDYFEKAGLPPPGDWIATVSEKSGGVVTAEKADVMNLHYDSRCFHRVLSISTIEHVLDDKKGLEEMKRVLVPDGLLLITTEYNEEISMPYDPDGCLRIYNKKDIEEICRGFKVEKKMYHFTGQQYGDIPFGTIFLKLRKIS